MKKIPWIKMVVVGGFFVLPLVTLVVFFAESKNMHSYIALFFLLSHCLERVWETFFTTKEKNVFEVQGDWTLIAVSFLYLILYLILVLDFFVNIKVFQSSLFLFLGLFIYVIAFSLRWWGMRTLGSQWAVHALGAKKINKVFLVTSGPYKYVRHPIYVAVILEILSLPIIFHSYWGLLFAVLFNVPLQLVRLVIEENNTVRKIGKDYLTYASSVGAILPWQLLIKK